MIKVKQTNDSIPGGDCLSACIASLLHMDIKDVPNFCNDAHRDWMIPFGKWLMNKGMGFSYMKFKENHTTCLPGPCILGVRTQTHVDEGVSVDYYLHAVVGRAVYDVNNIKFCIEHDPGMVQCSIVELVDVMWIVKNGVE